MHQDELPVSAVCTGKGALMLRTPSGYLFPVSSRTLGEQGSGLGKMICIGDWITCAFPSPFLHTSHTLGPGNVSLGCVLTE